MKRTALMLMVLTTLSKFLGFGREIILSYFYGASGITDAYLISQTIPTVMFAFISSAMATGFIPIYSELLKKGGKDVSDAFANNLSNALLILATFVVIIIMVFTEPIVKLFATGFTGKTLSLTVDFTRIGVFGVYFTAVLNIFSGYLRIQNNYLIPALIGIPMNIVLIISFAISSRTNIYLIAFGTVIASASQLVLLIPFLKRTGYRHKAILCLRDPNLKVMLLLALPVIIGTSVNEINVLVDRTLASSIVIGGISALNYANRLNYFIQGLFVASITTILFPTISKMVAENDMKGLKRYIGEAISLVGILVIPATIGSMIFSNEIVDFLFGRGAFDLEAINITGSALFFYSIGMIGLGMRNVLSRGFYALQDTKTPMINATIGVVINIILNFILSKYMGIGGLALATSISAIVTAILMFITLRKKIGPFGLKELTKSFIKISIASLIMGLIAYGSFILSGNYLSQNLSLIIAIGIGALVYAIIIYFMKIPEVDSTIIAIKNKLKSFKQKQKEQN